MSVYEKIKELIEKSDLDAWKFRYDELDDLFFKQFTPPTGEKKE